ATQIHDIRFRNVIIRSDYHPIHIAVYPDNLYGDISHLYFSGIRAVSGIFPCVEGRADAVLHDISFSDCSFEIKDIYGKPYPKFSHVAGLRMDNTVFDFT
ncbi:MAG: hypothetical protein MJ078_03545, partial [Clostridia bacterium]|nr:hypothetical protein [Clostridia bacterium]